MVINTNALEGNHKLIELYFSFIFEGILTIILPFLFAIFILLEKEQFNEVGANYSLLIFSASLFLIGIFSIFKMMKEYMNMAHWCKLDQNEFQYKLLFSNKVYKTSLDKLQHIKVYYFYRGRNFVFRGKKGLTKLSFINAYVLIPESSLSPKISMITNYLEKNYPS